MKSSMHRMNLKLDKMEEADMLKSWVVQKIDESRFKMQDFIDFELDKVKKDVNESIKNSLIVPGLIGPKEQCKNFPEYCHHLVEKFKEHYDRFLEVDDDIFKIIETDLPEIRLNVSII